LDQISGSILNGLLASCDINYGCLSSKNRGIIFTSLTIEYLRLMRLQFYTYSPVNGLPAIQITNWLTYDVFLFSWDYLLGKLWM